MYKAAVVTAEGKKRRKKQELPEALFDGVVHEPVLWQAVKAYRANRRSGTASTKTRSTIRGGGRKPWRQKGTGRARHGSIRSPIWKGGAVAFGPLPERNYRQRLPKKLKWLARRSAYNARAEDDKIVVVESLEFEAPKTKRIVAVLEAAGAEGNVLLLTDGVKELVSLSARNIPSVQVRPFGDESAYDVLWADTVIIEAPALERAAEVAHA